MACLYLQSMAHHRCSPVSSTQIFPLRSSREKTSKRPSREMSNVARAAKEPIGSGGSSGVGALPSGESLARERRALTPVPAGEEPGRDGIPFDALHLGPGRDPSRRQVAMRGDDPDVVVAAVLSDECDLLTVRRPGGSIAPSVSAVMMSAQRSARRRGGDPPDFIGARPVRRERQFRAVGRPGRLEIHGVVVRDRFGDPPAVAMV